MLDVKGKERTYVASVSSVLPEQQLSGLLDGGRMIAGSFFWQLGQAFDSGTHTLVKHRCRRSMHIHINETKSKEGKRKERKHEA